MVTKKNNPDGTARRPNWGRGADGPPPRSKIEEEDIQTRKRYRKAKLRSPYLAQIDIPDRVKAGDFATARQIATRIYTALEQQGKWSKPERTRLYLLHHKWNERASGRSIIFNIRGWEAQHMADRWFKRDKAMADLFDSIRSTFIPNQKGTGNDDDEG